MTLLLSISKRIMHQLCHFLRISSHSAYTPPHCIIVYSLELFGIRCSSPGCSGNSSTPSSRPSSSKVSSPPRKQSADGAHMTPVTTTTQIATTTSSRRDGPKRQKVDDDSQWETSPLSLISPRSESKTASGVSIVIIPK